MPQPFLPSSETSSDLLQQRMLHRFRRASLGEITTAHRVVPTELYSVEAMNALLRRFNLMQVNLHHVLVRAHGAAADEIEKRIRRQIDDSTTIMNSAALQAEDRLRSAGINEIGTGRLTPLVLPVKVFSSHARRYLELIGKFDRMMLMLEAMFIYGLIDKEDMDQQKAALKSEVRHVAYLVRDLRNPRCARSKR